ncbi:MAG: hypothetical protein R3B95_10650 [Nitrospirales bacterium]|nr:HDOD domain-containing protein [Nitrospirales bacterium]
MKVLQLATSSFFPYKGKVTMLSNATIFISYNGILATVVSCTLVRHLVASTCHAIGDVCGQKDSQELVLVGSIQDIGMLILEPLISDLYQSKLLNQCWRTGVIVHEREILGITHAPIGR